MKFIGIDIGTTTICGVVFDTDKKKVLDYVTRQNSSELSVCNNWEHLQDPSMILNIATSILNNLTQKHSDIKGIGITGQMHGILYVDKNGNAVSPLYTWKDSRGNLIYESETTYAEQLSRISGYKIASGYGLLTHYYNQQNSLCPDSAEKICTIQDYVVMHFSNSKTPKTDSTNAASLGIYDLNQNQFNKDALEKAGIDINILPDIIDSSEKLETVNNNIPLYVAIGDNQAAFMSSVSNTQQSISINIGTGSQISIHTNKHYSVEGLDTRPFPGNGFLLVGAPLCGGSSYALLKQFFEDSCRLFNCSPDANIYEIMNSIDVQSIKDNEILDVQTQFMGSRTNPSKRGSIDNISINNFKPEYLIHGILRGIINELRGLYNLIPDDLKENHKYLIGSGNGLRKNKLLKLICQDIFGNRMHISEFSEEASVGAAIHAARCTKTDLI